MRVAIVGAGASGLPAIRNALQYGVEPIAFEMSDAIGGLWRYKPIDCDESSVMKSTVINSSKEMTAYSDLPPPTHFANYMHNRQMLHYLQLYADHHQLLKHVRFGHRVINVRRADDFDASGQWMVEYADSNGNLHNELFDGVLICTGHHTKPYMPVDWPNQHKFRGRIIHSHSYKDHVGYEDARIVVVGVGNSGGDIAVELSRIAQQVYLSTRRGTWVLNRIFDYGIPTDLMLNVRLLQILRNYVPTWLVDFAFEWKLDQRFSHANYGLKPAHSFFGAHPTINDELPNRIACGTIVVKPNIRRFTVNGIEFDDGTIADNIDVVILSTGYTFTFPMLESGTLISVDNNHVDLYKYMYIPTLSHHTLALIGLIQPLGSIMPIAEMQSRVYFDVLTGRSRLPSTIAMIDDIKQKRMNMEQRYVVSRRHTIQVDYVPYMDELADLIGARPNIIRMALNDPLLAYRLLTGPNLPYVYRLCGPHRWSGARRAIVDVWERVDGATKTRTIDYDEGYAISNRIGFMIIFGLILISLLSFLF